MRKLLVFISIFSVSLLMAQSDSLRQDRNWGIALDGQTLLGSKGGFGNSIQLSARFYAAEFGVLAGFKNREASDMQPYDLATSKGQWIEPNVGVLVPVWGNDHKMVANRTKLYMVPRLGYGFCTSENNYSSTFISSGPYLSYEHEEKYEKVNTHYVSISVGNRFEVINHIRLEYGLLYLKYIDEDERRPDSTKLPFTFTPYNGRSPLGAYFRIGVML